MTTATIEAPTTTTVVLDFSKVLALRECVSKDEARFVMNCVHIADGYAEATNGHILTRIPVETGELDVLVKGDVFRMVKAGQSLSITADSVTILAKYGVPLAVVPDPFDLGTFPNVKQVLGTIPTSTHRFIVSGKYLAKLAKMADKTNGRVEFALTFQDGEPHTRRGHSAPVKYSLPTCVTGLHVSFAPDVSTEVVLMPLRPMND